MSDTLKNNRFPQKLSQNLIINKFFLILLTVTYLFTLNCRHKAQNIVELFKELFERIMIGLLVNCKKYTIECVVALYFNRISFS